MNSLFTQVVVYDQLFSSRSALHSWEIEQGCWENDSFRLKIVFHSSKTSKDCTLPFEVIEGTLDQAVTLSLLRG